MKDVDVVLLILVGVFAALIGVFTAWNTTDHSWQQDCEHLGKHRSGGEVYECRKVGK